MNLPNSEWNEHLQTRFVTEKSGYTFDMDDGPERSLAEKFTKLSKALDYLDKNVCKAFRTADENALGHQKWHKRLAAVAIIGGGLAVVLAIIQLAMPRGSQSGITFLEWFAASAGTVAVVFGLLAKRDHQWFIQRHVAERLRMLKFRSLGMRELWCGDSDAWEKALALDLERTLSLLKQDRRTSMKLVEMWSAGGSAEPFEPPPPECFDPKDQDQIRAISDYYRTKRVNFQAAYFAGQSKRFQKRVTYIRHAGLPLFFASIAMVIIHSIAHHYHADGLALIALTLAAAIPVVSFGLRAWIGAFEHTRSASLFEAKSHALASISEAVEKDCMSVPKTMHHISHVEHFLEHEHREWLRLMLDAEWFL